MIQLMTHFLNRLVSILLTKTTRTWVHISSAIIYCLGSMFSNRSASVARRCWKVFASVVNM